MAQSRLDILQDLQIKVTEYSRIKTDEWRPGLLDLWTFDTLVAMYESDYEDVEFMSFIWRKKPDEIMQHILDSRRIFDLEYGIETFQDELRDYMTDNDFIVHVDDVSDEEYQANLEGK